MKEKDRLVKLCYDALEKHFLDEFSMHITRVSGDDGYLSDDLFPVIYFEVSEFKGWLFGVYLEGYNSDTKTLSGDLFFQYKMFIDKFKPTYSTYDGTIDFVFREEGVTRVICPLDDDIRFIQKEPSLAKARDLYMWDYNTAHHTRVEAFFKVNAYIFKLKLEKRIKKAIRTRYARKFKALCAHYFDRVKMSLYTAHVTRDEVHDGRWSFEELSHVEEYKVLVRKLRKLNEKITRTCNALSKVGIEIYVTRINDIVFDL